MDTDTLKQFCADTWDKQIIPALQDYIRIPAKSPNFDADWEANGYIEKAVQLAAGWCKKNALPDMQLEIHRLPGRTPLLFIEIPGTTENAADKPCILLYGHLDKQPEFDGWREGLSPWEPVIQDGKLYRLQTRNGKRTAAASLRMAVDMAHEGLISEAEAVQRVNPSALDQLLHPTLDPKAPRTLLAKGLPASPGAACGGVVFNADEAESRAQKGEAVILVRVETSPEDIHGMHAARGILTTRGGMTSHAAVVARGMGRPCVAGAGGIHVDYGAKTLSAGGVTGRDGQTITLEGASGEVFVGMVPMIEPALSGDFSTLMEWADKERRLRVRANAETPLDAETARKFGAEGIGLSRTEHMFFDPERIGAVRQMIMAADSEGRRAALARLLPYQRGDFVSLFRIMAGLPVTIRLLDPPLHEFLPHGEEELAEVAEALGMSHEAIRHRAAELSEANPMLGHRGCRLGISYPEIYEMQARAIFEAAIEVAKESGEAPVPEIMIPLVGVTRELEITRAMVERVAQAVFDEGGTRVEYSVGRMIELPRAAITADHIAGAADFFSFGTNDLTQTVFGFSRDDAGLFLPRYVQTGILPKDPFVSLDLEGVGEMIRIAAEKGRATKPGIKLGICGEHGGDPASIAFCEQTGLDYVSCSPYRVPVARLAAAQAAIGAAGDTTA